MRKRECTSLLTLEAPFPRGLLYSFWHKVIFFLPCKPFQSETYVSASVKEIDYVQLGIVNQAELKLQPRALFSFCTAAYTEVKNNREAHEYYLKHTIEQVAILREVVKQAKLQNPLNSASYLACMYVKLIQELLGYVRDTCLDIHKPSDKLFMVTPINKKKIVRFADTVKSSDNIPKVTNRPLLSSTGVNPSTSASGSKPSGNTKNDRILQTPSSNEKNKVEVQSKKVKSNLNKMNHVSKNVCNKHVKHPIKGAKALYSVCNACLFDANHAMCLINHVNSMNVRAKYDSKKNKKRKEWKPTSKVFNSVRYKWKPTGRTVTLVGNACTLTRLTATNKVPLRIPIPLEVVPPKHVVTRVYTRMTASCILFIIRTILKVLDNRGREESS
ncbi:hypothetical protein Tco_1186295 [Tanacetum coccineum]